MSRHDRPKGYKITNGDVTLSSTNGNSWWIFPTLLVIAAILAVYGNKAGWWG